MGLLTSLGVSSARQLVATWSIYVNLWKMSALPFNSLPSPVLLRKYVTQAHDDLCYRFDGALWLFQLTSQRRKSEMSGVGLVWPRVHPVAAFGGTILILFVDA